MKFLVLGASGFLGSYLGYALEAAGHQVTGVARKPVPHYSDARAVVALENVEREIHSDSWDVVVNCIAMASHEECQADPSEADKVNAVFPALWARAAFDTGSRFLHVSTDAVFDGESDSLYLEDYPPQPGSVYGATKLRGEQEVQRANPQALITRTNFFGWSEDRTAGILDFFVSAVEEEREVVGFQDYVVSSLYAGDLVDAWLGLLAARAEGLFHVVSSTPESKYAFGIEVARALGSSGSFIRPGFLAERAGMDLRGHHLGLSTAKAEVAMGLPLPTTREGIARAILERQMVSNHFSSGARSGRG
jgi:dTDP-4-dehydrorhamnose reductase